MAAPSPTVTEVNDWLYAVIKGVNTPGTIPRGGMTGFRRPTGWDEKKGKGTQGATLTLTSAPPAKGEIALQLIGPGGYYANGNPSTDFAQWDSFVLNVLSVSPKQQEAEGLSFYHPSTSSVGIVSVVIEDYSPPEHVGRGLYIAKIKLIEWQPPPPVSIVKTVASQAPDDSNDTQVVPVDPRITALQQQIAAAQAANSP